MIDKLNNHYSMTNPASVYDEESLTALELAGRTAKKVNECVDAFNELDTYTKEYLKGVVEKHIPNNVNKWLDDHPEATTTVQDHSLNIHKFIIGELGYITPQMFGAVGDGVTDDTQAIQNALDCLENGGVLLLNKHYKTTGVIVNHSNIIVDGKGTLEQIPTDKDNYFTLKIPANVENVTIKNINFIGERNSHLGTTGEWGMGVDSYGNNITLDNLKLINYWGDGIYIGAESGDVTIQNCHIDNNRRQGISVIEGNNITILNCTITNTNGTAPQAGIDFEPNNVNQKIKNIVVDGCFFEGNKGATILFVGGSFMENAVITNCVMYGNGVQFYDQTDTEGNGTILISDCLFNVTGKLFAIQYSYRDKKAKVNMNNCVINGGSRVIYVGESNKDFIDIGGLTITNTTLKNFTEIGGFYAGNSECIFKNCLIDVIVDKPQSLYRANVISFENITYNCNLFTPINITITISNYQLYSKIVVNRGDAEVKITLNENSVPIGSSITFKNDNTVQNVKLILGAGTAPQLSTTDKNIILCKPLQTTKVTHLQDNVWKLEGEWSEGV